MLGLKITIIAMVLVLSVPAHSRAGPDDAQDKAASAQEDSSLPIYKHGWQFFLAPYLWVPGAHLDISHQGRFHGTTVADIPWYNIVPLLFSKVFGGMGRVEVWHGRWGVFSDSIFIYIGDSVSGGGSRELKLTVKRVPVTIPLRLQLSGNLKLWTRLLWQDVGARFLLGAIPLKADKPLPVLSCELLGGIRYTYYNQATRLGVDATLTGPRGAELISRGGSFFDSSVISLVEPLLGLRFNFWCTPKLNLLLKADCGGFGCVAYNHVDTNIEALLGYLVSKNIRMYAGYRGRYFSAVNNGKGIAAHGWFRGPMLGTVFNF